MKIKKELIRRDIAGDTVLVPVGKSVYDSNGLFVMNEVGAFIWNLLPQAQSPEDIVRRVMEEYAVTEETAAADTAEFLARLGELGIL